MDYQLFFPTKLENTNTTNNNIDVCLQLKNGKTYTLVFATPNNLELMMKKEKSHFIYPETRFLIVDELSEENIRQTIEYLLLQDSKFIEFYGGDII